MTAVDRTWQAPADGWPDTAGGPPMGVVLSLFEQWRDRQAAAVGDVLGADLHEGSAVLDVAGIPHVIDHFAEYPGLYMGDHARRAYDAEGGWCATVGDHEHFHVQPEGEQ